MKNERRRYFPLPAQHRKLSMLAGPQEVEFGPAAINIEKLMGAINNAPNYGQPAQLIMNKAELADIQKTFLK